MIAHHVIRVRRQHDWRRRSHIAKTLRHIRLRDVDAIHVDATVVDFETISGQCDHALDVALGRVLWVIEDDNVAAADVLEVIHKLVDEDAVLILQPRQHAGAFDPHRLIEERNDEECHGERNEDVARPDRDRATAAAPFRNVEWVWFL